MIRIFEKKFCCVIFLYNFGKIYDTILSRLLKKQLLKKNEFYNHLPISIMKKTLLFALVLAGLSANAQLTDGSIAPDFTATDINEGVHSLYADYLDNGKSVIIDFSATWCLPCWNYHQTHAMADLYEAYGKDGSDEIGVFFIEGDTQTTVTDNLYGIQVPGKSITRGNWTIGSPYPIIEDTAAMNLGGNAKYKVAYFPQMYMVCEETKTTKLVDQQTAIQLRNSLGACQTLVGLPNHGKVENAARISICESGDVANVQAKIKNFGNNAITSAHVVLKKGDVVVAEQDYTGSLGQFATPATLTFNDVALEIGANYTFELTSLNGGAAAKADLTIAPVEFGTPIVAPNNNVEVRVYTDNAPTEITWEIKNSNGDVVLSGGPYTAAQKNQMLTYYLPIAGEGIQCHAVVMKDSAGNGWNSGSEAHGMQIISDNVLVFSQPIGNFGSSVTYDRAFSTTGVLGNKAFVDETFAMYPNPTSGIVNFTTQEVIDVTVIDITGKVVHTAKGLNNGDSINLSKLQTGVYVAKISGEKSERTEKIIIK